MQPHGLYRSWNSLGQNIGVGKPFPSPEDLPNPGIEARSPALQVDSLLFEPPGKPRQNKAPRKDAHVQIPGACERHVTWLCCACLVAQSCPTLCDPMDCSPPGSSVHGILQARILGWVAVSFSGDLPDPGSEPASLTSPALVSGFSITSAPWASCVL